MALEFSKRPILSTDKRYFFLEDYENESDGNKDLFGLFKEIIQEGLQFHLGYDKDRRYPLVPSKLLAFDNDTETEE